MVSLPFLEASKNKVYGEFILVEHFPQEVCGPDKVGLKKVPKKILPVKWCTGSGFSKRAGNGSI